MLFSIILPNTAIAGLFSKPADFELLHHYAQFAGISYSGQDQVVALCHKLGFKLIVQDTLDNSYVRYIAADNLSDNSTRIAIRGTANLENVLLDLEFQLKFDPELKINAHKGFVTAARDIARALLPKLDKSRSVELTGHSLGGAVAVALGMFLQQQGFEVRQIITFGQPKLTTYTGARQFSGLNIIRVSSHEDIIPMVPPINAVDLSDLSNLTIYWHLGDEVVLFPGSHYAQLGVLKSLLRAADFVHLDYTEQSLRSHEMRNYLQLLEIKRQNSNEISYSERSRHLNPRSYYLP